MKFALIVTAAPQQSHAARSALEFAAASVRAGHEIVRVFFYFDGVFTASSLVVTPQDEVDLGERWAAFGADHGVELAVCIAASLRRGVLDSDEAARYERVAGNVRPGFEIVGLGQLVDAMISADRCITFGP